MANNEMVSMKYSGPDGLVFDSVAPYNEGNRFMQKNAVYSVPEDVAEELDIYEGWSREGEESVAERSASAQEESPSFPRGDADSMRALNTQLGAEESGEGESTEDSDEENE